MAALRSPNAVATNTASEGYHHARSPQRASRAEDAPLDARRQSRSSELHVGKMVAGGMVAMETFTARKSAMGTNATRTSMTREQARPEGEPRERAQDPSPSTGIGPGDDVSRGQMFSGLYGHSIVLYVILNTEKNKVISSFAPLFSL